MSTVVNVESALQQNFQPSWMKSAFHGNGGGGTGDGSQKTVEDYSTDAKSVEYSYTREQLLALVAQESDSPPPGIAEAVLYADVANSPVVNKPLSQREEMHAGNINSGKAMAAISPDERTRIYNGGEHQLIIPPKNTTGWAKGNGWGRGGTTPERGRGASTPRGGMLRGTGRGLSTDALTESSGTTPLEERSWRARGTPTQRSPGVIGSRDMGREKTGDELAGSDEEGGWTQAGKPRSSTKRQTSSEWVSARKPESNPWSAHRDNTKQTSGVANGSSPSTTNAWKDRAAIMQSLGQEQQKRTSEEPEDGSGAKPSSVWSTPSRQVSDSGRSITPETSTYITTTSNTDRASSSVSQTANDATRPRVSESGAIPSPSFGWPSPSLDLVSLTSALPQASMGMPVDNMLAELQKQQLLFEMQKQQMVNAIVAHQQQQRPLEQECPVSWLYVDPNDQEQGPFETEQMTKWYEAGYFEDETLRVRRENDRGYKTIGELKQINGEKAPFDFPKPIPQPLPFAPQFNPLANPLLGTPNLWSTPINPILDPAFSGILEAERRRINEEKAREQEEIRRVMLEEVERQRLLNEARIKEQEKEVQARVEALQRHELEVNQKATMIQEMMRQKQALDEKQKEIDRQRELEADRLRKEKEQLKRREEQLETMRKAEVTAEKEAQRLKEAEKQAMEFAIAKKAADKRRAEEERERQEAADLARRGSVEKKKGFEITSAWETAPRPRVDVASTSVEDSEEWTQVSNIANKQKKSVGAPWAPQQQKAASEKSLREIQEEEERKLRQQQEEETKRREKLKAEAAAAGASLPRPPVWTPLAGLVTATEKPKLLAGKTAWNVSVNPITAPANISPLLDGPSLAAANKIAQPQPKKVQAPAKPAQPAPVKQQPQQTPKKPLKNSIPDKSDEFRTWFVKKYQQISKSNVDTADIEVLFDFISELNKPTEVEDYLMSYLDESKAVKEFVREFLQRRIELKSRANNQEVDDLTSARTAATPQTQPGRKKKKNQKVVLDGSCLGFRATAASNRINQGEIETVPLPAGVKRA